MKYKIIGIAGPARSGKDTAANHIMKLLPEYCKTSFADPIKIMLSEGLGLTADQLFGNKKETLDSRYGCSARHLMQTLGTEWGRTLIDQNIWVNALQTRIDTLGGNWIVPDVRFESEANMIRKNGVLINIIGRETIDKTHQSEKGIYVQDGDIIIPNKSTIEQFLSLVERVSETYLS